MPARCSHCGRQLWQFADGITACGVCDLMLGAPGEPWSIEGSDDMSEWWCPECCVDLSGDLPHYSGCTLDTKAFRDLSRDLGFRQGNQDDIPRDRGPYDWEEEGTA